MDILAYDFEKEFNKDIRDKKRTASGIFKRKSTRRGGSGKMVTTMDLLTGKEKREYMKAGDVKVMSAYKEVIPFEELTRFAYSTQKEILENWREKHTQKEIVNGLGVNKNIYYKKLYDLKILDKPDSEIKKEQTTQTYKPHTEIEAKKEEILPYGEFRKLSKEEQYFLLDCLYDRFTTRSIAHAWDRKVSSLHQIRYQLKKYMLDNELPLENESFKGDVWSKYGVVLNEPYESTIEEESVATSPLNDSSDESQMSLLEVASAVEEEKEIQRESEDKESLNSLKEMMENQQEFLITLAQEQKDLKMQMVNHEKTDNVAVIPLEKEKSSSGMHFTFEEEKEGFLLHHELVQFISVLEKNPNAFHVDIKITKKD